MAEDLLCEGTAWLPGWLRTYCVRACPSFLVG